MMEYRQLGSTGMKASVVGLGCEHLHQKDYTLVDAVVKSALEKGINILDVFMPQEQVRSDIGRALGTSRRDVLLQGHIGATVVDGQYTRSREVALCDTFVKDFLARYNTDYIDIGMMHFIDTQEDFEASFNSPYIDYCQALKRQGIIRSLGVSTHNVDTAQRMVDTGLIDVIMFSINPVYDMFTSDVNIDGLFNVQNFKERSFDAIDPKRQHFYNTCEAMGIGITVMKALGSSMLLNEQLTPFTRPLTVHQLMHYAATRPAVASVLVGCQRVEEVMVAAQYPDTTAQDRDFGLLADNINASLKGQCMYCNHCLPCPSGIDIAAVTKYFDIARVQKTVPDTIRDHYQSLSAHGEDCIGCQSCEQRCPFGVNVTRNMADAAALFGR